MKENDGFYSDGWNLKKARLVPGEYSTGKAHALKILLEINGGKLEVWRDDKGVEIGYIIRYPKRYVTCMECGSRTEYKEYMNEIPECPNCKSKDLEDLEHIQRVNELWKKLKEEKAC
mgnify:CR=1 FL=1